MVTKRGTVENGRSRIPIGYSEKKGYFGKY